jgi:hypothetical protein
VLYLQRQLQEHHNTYHNESTQQPLQEREGSHEGVKLPSEPLALVKSQDLEDNKESTVRTLLYNKNADRLNYCTGPLRRSCFVKGK